MTLDKCTLNLLNKDTFRTQRTALSGAVTVVSSKDSQGQLVPSNLCPNKALTLKACLCFIILLLISSSKHNLSLKLLFFGFILSLEVGVVPWKVCDLWGKGTWGLDCHNIISCMTFGTSLHLKLAELWFFWLSKAGLISPTLSSSSAD